MNGNTLDDNALMAAVEAYEDTGFTRREMAEHLQMTIGQLAGRIYRAKDKDAPPPKPDLFRNRLPDPMRLEGDWLIFGDLHNPFVDYDFAGNILKVARKRGIRKLLGAGDIFNMDVFSSYEDVIKLPTWKEEKEAFQQLLLEWLEWFDEIKILMGNHDRRLQKWTKGQFDDTDIIGMVMSGDGLGQYRDKVTSSVYGWCIIDTPSGPWRVTHPRNYGINQLTVADVLANKYQMHVITHHEHHTAIGWDRYKHFVTVNNGCLCDQRKLAYVMLDDSKSARMAKSFTVLQNGTPTLYGEAPFTDWGAV